MHKKDNGQNGFRIGKLSKTYHFTGKRSHTILSTVADKIQDPITIKTLSKLGTKWSSLL